MKKYSFLLFALLLVLSFTGCKADITTEEMSSITSSENDVYEVERDTYYNTFENFERTFTAVRVDEKNYIIRTSDDFAGDFYEIYDNNGNLLDKGFHGWRGSFDISIKNNIVTLKYGFGGTNVHPYYRFYDVEKGIASRYFEGPIAVYDTLIAYFSENEEKVTLVVQDIFDIEQSHIEFSGEFDRFVWMKIQEISFSEDGSRIILKHGETNNESNVMEEIFILN